MRTERANAKINLYLNVLSKREDGYHDLVSLMHSVSLCDLVTVDFHPAPHTAIRLLASGNDEMPKDCRNLAWRAAELFLASAQRTGEVLISIEKHIPMAAGLAGGSTDAAAVLRGLNALCGKPFNTEQLCQIGKRLGADVPFCIVGGSALVTGIGERLERMPIMSDCPMVVACMGEGVSTPMAYRMLDEKYADFSMPVQKDRRVERLCEGLHQGKLDIVCDNLYNLFEEVVPATHSSVNRVKEIMTEKGAIRAMMSGSGPSVFGVFADPQDALAACEALREQGASAFVCHPCAENRGA